MRDGVVPRGYVKPSLKERLEEIAELEGLEGYTETVEFLVREYNTFPPGYPGGYVRLRQEYAARLENAEARVEMGELTHEELMEACHPDAFLKEKGVKHTELIRREWGRYAARRLAPLDEAFQELNLSHASGEE